MVALCINLGGTSVKIGAVEGGIVREKVCVDTRADGDYNDIVRTIAEAALPSRRNLRAFSRRVPSVS